MTSKSRLQPLARAVLRTQGDDRLVALVRDGKEAAFEEIVRRYRTSLVAFAAAYAPADAEDVVQESLARSWDSLRNSTGEMHLKAWLYTIVRNRALNAKRDARPTEPLSDQLDGVRQPPEIVLSKEELGCAVAAVAALPEQQREALVRSALEGHTHEQIAASIGTSPGAVRQLIYRGRIAVRHGVGAVIPLPVVAALAEAGTGAAGVGGGAIAGGAAAGAAGGASVATKAALTLAVGAIAAGSGVAIERSQRDSGRQDDRGSTGQLTQGRPEADSAQSATTIAEASGPGAGLDPSGPGSRRNEREEGDHSGHGPTGAGDGNSPGSGPSQSSGPGPDGSVAAAPASGSGDGPGGGGSGESSGDGSSGPGSSSGHDSSGSESGDSSGESGSGDSSGESGSSGDSGHSSDSGSSESGGGSGDDLSGEITTVEDPSGSDSGSGDSGSGDSGGGPGES